MEPQKKSQTKLTRTQSSLLRSSPTIRSSIHSLSSINDLDLDPEQYDNDDDKNNKMKKKKSKIPGSTPRTGSNRVTIPVLAVASLGFFSACSLFLSLFYFFFYEVPTSENVLLALIFIAVTLYFASKNKRLINHTLSSLKHSWDDNVKKFGFSKTHHKPVQWVIGDSGSAEKNKNKVIREGVEFYSNGDFYEGEFHRGRSNGSGVYNYFVNGRYEGDWVDGRYDGYGIESWARGSRYRGQYRQGLRHGYGVYRFYTGDSYAGEWCNGQSHGVGVQTCSDGSSYIGEFKYGVKHGLGCYHFRSVSYVSDDVF